MSLSILSLIAEACANSFSMHALTQYNDLVKKKEIVENDKLKIAELITQLDHKKNEALEGAYERVNTVSLHVREDQECNNI